MKISNTAWTLIGIAAGTALAALAVSVFQVKEAVAAIQAPDAATPAPAATETNTAT